MPLVRQANMILYTPDVEEPLDSAPCRLVTLSNAQLSVLFDALTQRLLVFQALARYVILGDVA